MIKRLTARTSTAIAGVAALAAASFGPSASAPRQCQVSVDRSADSGSFSVVRQEFDNNRCVCAITTGPSSQASSVEQQISSLVTNRSCAGAETVAMSGGQNGLSSAFLAAGAGGLVIAGLAIAIGDDEDRPVSP